MKAFYIITFLFIAFQTAAQTRLGLKFTDPAQLEGIPIASTPFSGQDLPAKTDLSVNMPPAGNQGNQSSCVAWAIAYACKSYQESIEENVRLSNGTEINKDAVFSPAFIYNQTNDGEDEGSLFTDALNVISQQGAVKWSDMPYNPADFLTKPAKSQLEKAKKYQIDFWRRVNIKDIKEVKAQLNAGYPVIIGAIADKGFMDAGNKAAGTTDFIWKAQIGEQLGGHAMLVVGYDNAKSAFKVLNSWGTKWGNKGYCWIDYQHFPKVVREGYVMKDAINAPDSKPAEPITKDPVENKAPNALAELEADFQLTNVMHNFMDNQLGQVMRFDGIVNVPPGAGRNIQIVVRFYLNDGRNGRGELVGSWSPYFAMPDGSAACGTPKANGNIGFTTWYASLPYEVLKVPRGGYQYGQYQLVTTNLIAEPILFIDDFAVKTGGLIPFFVNL